MKTQQGYILFFSMILTAIILSLLIGIATIAFRQRIFSQQVRQSTVSLYAADTALQCLIAADAAGRFGSVPADLVGGPYLGFVYCNGGAGTTSGDTYSGPNGSTIFLWDTDQHSGLSNNGFDLIEVVPAGSAVSACARGRITKFEDTGQTNALGDPIYKHTIEVWGYNVACTDLQDHDAYISSGNVSNIETILTERSLSYTYESE